MVKKTCPKCGKKNAVALRICSCGYAFIQKGKSGKSKKRKKTSKNVISPKISKISNALDKKKEITSWNTTPGECGPGVTFLPDNQTTFSDQGAIVVTKKGYSKGQHYWEVDVTTPSNSSWIGLATLPIENYNTWLGQHYYAIPGYANATGDYHVRAPENSIKPCRPLFKADDTVGLLLDMDKKNCAYYLNGKLMGLVFDNLPDTIYPAISNASAYADYITRFDLPIPKLVSQN